MENSLTIESVVPPVKIGIGLKSRVLLGRSRSSDVVLNDPAVSRQHCALVSSTDGIYVEDLGSVSGTFVNGQRVTCPTKLANDDQIKIGNTILRFETYAQADSIGGSVHAEHNQEMSAAVSDVTVVRRSGIQVSTRQVPSPLPAQIPLKESLIIGRDPGCDVVVPNREVSRRHAHIQCEAGIYMVSDMGSTNGTFLNNVDVRDRTPLREGARLRVGPNTFLVRENFLLPSCQKGKVRISLQNLTREVISRDTKQKLLLLDNISLVIEPNEFVALLGPSGSGKSTLMDAVNGRRPADTGKVWVNDDDFYQTYRYYRRTIGYVPQKDIVHSTLTVQQALTFTAQLRLPSDTSKVEIKAITDEVLQTIGLSERRHTLIANLSGGQLKRVSLGVELIADPSLLFLDEATSGLDAGTEARMMGLFRQIADEGKTVLCITHNVENIKLCDLAVVLASGKLVYYGPPADLPGYFGVTETSEVYDRLESERADEWVKR